MGSKFNVYQFSASMWSPEEAQTIREIAERERPGKCIHYTSTCLSACFLSLSQESKRMLYHRACRWNEGRMR